MAIDDASVTPAELPAIVEQAAWIEHLPAIIKDVLIRGGDTGEGAINFQARVLDARTRYLYQLVQAINSGGVILQGNLPDQEALDAIETADLPIGTSYFVEYALRTWNGTVWTTSGSLRGARGINLLGTWPTGLDLPLGTEHETGDAYLWRNDIWILMPNAQWESMNIRGADGKSAYQVWEEIEENNGKSVTEYIAAMKGEKGDSSYEEWEKQPGNKDKSYAEYIEFIRGHKGDTGPARAPFRVMGIKPDSASVPTPGKEDEAWYVGIDLYVWVEATTSYVVIPGINGLSALQQWLAIPGNEEKTEADFWIAMKGDKGADSVVPGPKGDAGGNLRVIGTVADSDELGTIINPQDQDGYVAMDTGRLWMWLVVETVGSWKDLGPFRGLNGKSAYDLWLEEPGNAGKPIAAFWTYLKGTDGKSIVIEGVVETYADLPGSPEEQWVYAVRDVSSFYAYVNAGWILLGSFGKDGAPGKDGKSLDIIKILTEGDPTPPAADASTLGKAYLDLDKIVWVNIQNSWQNAGPFRGEQGEIGETKWVRPRGTVATLSALPPLVDVEEGEMWYTADTKLGYVKVDGQWSEGIDNIGPEGKEGPEGKPGALMPILGLFPTMGDLTTAHPTGARGDAWLITNGAGRDLAVWNVDTGAWQNTGPAGIPGQKGDTGEGTPGKPGLKGDKGSQWLTLETHDEPSVSFNGRAGDWAVNLDNKIFYKTVDKGWVYWGTLVAGDVNSPLLSQGRVVRLGNEWVPESISEVEDPEAGKYYARELDGLPAEGKTKWAELPVIIPELPAKTEVPQVRVWPVNQPKPIWMDLLFPEAFPDAPADGKDYVRTRAVEAEDGSWKQLPELPPPLPGNDDKFYWLKNKAWEAFNRYDLAITTLSATATIDPKVSGFVVVNNTAGGAKTFTLADGPKAPNARALVLPVIIEGASGLITFAPTGATPLGWDKGTAPAPTGVVSILTFTWTGTRWIGAAGPSVPA